jgi:hypothetical protein
VNSSTLSDVTFLVEGWYYFTTLISSVDTLNNSFLSCPR